MPQQGEQSLLGDESGVSPQKDSLRAWLYLIKCARRIDQVMSDRFRNRFNSSFPRFDVLAHLHQAGSQGLSTSLLAARLLASKGNITRLLDRMEHDGLILRQSHPEDRRISKVTLSPRGAELFERMAGEHEEWSHELLNQLNEADKQTLVRLLQQLSQGLEQK